MTGTAGDSSSCEAKLTFSRTVELTANGLLGFRDGLAPGLSRAGSSVLRVRCSGLSFGFGRAGLRFWRYRHRMKVRNGLDGF